MKAPSSIWEISACTATQKSNNQNGDCVSPKMGNVGFIAYRNHPIKNVGVQEYGEGYGLPLWTGLKEIELAR